MLKELDPEELRKLIKHNYSQSGSQRFQQLGEDEQLAFGERVARVFEQMQSSHQYVVQSWRDFRWVEEWQEGSSKVGGTIIYFDHDLQREPFEMQTWRADFKQWARQRKMSNSEVTSIKRTSIRNTLFVIQSPIYAVSEDGFKYEDPNNSPQDFYTAGRIMAVFRNRAYADTV